MLYTVQQHSALSSNFSDRKIFGWSLKNTTFDRFSLQFYKYVSYICALGNNWVILTDFPLPHSIQFIENCDRSIAVAICISFEAHTGASHSVSPSTGELNRSIICVICRWHPEYKYGANWLPATWSRFMACVHVWCDQLFFLRTTDEWFEG